MWSGPPGPSDPTPSDSPGRSLSAGYTGSFVTLQTNQCASASGLWHCGSPFLECFSPSYSCGLLPYFIITLFYFNFLNWSIVDVQYFISSRCTIHHPILNDTFQCNILLSPEYILTCAKLYILLFLFFFFFCLLPLEGRFFVNGKVLWCSFLCPGHLEE